MEFHTVCDGLETETLQPGERVEKMTPFLLDWFQENARVLPWRTDPKPYYVWVSEIMLQQTRVEAVKPYFNRFIAALPDIWALAECREELLLKLWEGLGYYNRVRNMQRAAKIITEQYQGELPADYEKLLLLPGIGSYTAGAIASIAYGIPVPAVDGNVLRVMARLTGSYEDIAMASVKKQTEVLLKQYMPEKTPGIFNQAMMEIGALVCLPNGEPKCVDCPICSLCLAYKRKIVMELPVKTKKKARRIEEKTVFVIRLTEKHENGREKIALHRRSKSGLLAGMYEFPNVSGKLDRETALKILEDWEIEVNSITSLEEARHIFSHVEWDMKGYLVEGTKDWKQIEKETEKNRDRVFVQKVAENGTYHVNQSKVLLEYFTAEKIRTEFAIPSAFSVYTKYIEKLVKNES